MLLYPKYIKGFLRIGFALFFLAILLKCALVPTKDDLTPGISKGFVEFYSREHLFKSPMIYSIQNKKVLLEGQVPLRIAKPPGIHHFMVGLGTAERHIQISIEENKITPVRVLITNLRKINDKIVTGIRTEKIAEFSFNLALIEEPKIDLK